MKLFINFLVLAVAIQIVCYLFWAFDVFGGLIDYPLGDISSLENTFSINIYSALIGVGGAALIGLAALLLKQGVYAVYAMLLWGIGVMFSVVQTFILAIPNTLAALLPAATNPNPTLFPTNPLIIVISMFFAFGAWMYMFGLVIQRETS